MPASETTPAASYGNAGTLHVPGTYALVAVFFVAFVFLRLLSSSSSRHVFSAPWRSYDEEGRATTRDELRHGLRTRRPRRRHRHARRPHCSRRGRPRHS